MSTATYNNFSQCNLDMLYQVMKQQQQQNSLLSTLPQSTQQTNPTLPLERKAVGSPIANRQRAVSCTSPVDSTSSLSPKFNPTMLNLNEQLQNVSVSHRKLDRSFSEPVDNRPGSAASKSSNINPSRYKTEMCRPFEESGHCKYGDKCQFAHGAHELRNLARHPKYKTDLCRTFHTIGFCPYGPRCHFIHNEDERKLSNIIMAKHQQAFQQAAQQVAQQAAQQAAAQQAAQQHAAALQQLQIPTSTIQQQQRSNNLMVSTRTTMPPPGFRDLLGSTADSPPDSPPDSITSESPQSLSPTSGLSDHDVFSPSSSLGSSALTPPPSSGFSFPTSQQDLTLGGGLTSSMAPLNINTDNFASLLAGLQALQQQQQQQQHRDSLKSQQQQISDLFPTPPSPPESLNGDSEVSSFRLPIFSQLSED